MSALRYFRKLAEGLDPGGVMAELNHHPELYSRITVRQAYAGSAHRDTQTIVLRGPSSAQDLFDNLDTEPYAYFRELHETQALLHEALAPLHCRELGRVMIVKLKAGGRITPHVDEGAYARYYARAHLVLRSNPSCVFHAGGESVRMASGELWWFNHQVEHGVVNDGPDRTHLIVDFCAPGFTGALS